MTISALIEKFSVNALKDFFRKRINTFKPIEENYEFLFDENTYINDNYKDITKIGEADLTNSDDLIVITAKTLAPLTNRTGKKRQFEIAKKILKEENKDAAIFVFYDDDGNFRFSLIRANFLGTKRDFTDFKRYTYFVSPKQTNKTFINQLSKCDFNNLNSIQDAFSVEPITKQFYEKLQRWYFWAIKNVKFPKDAERETNGREVAIIRLITRLMFIWFMKVRNLIPNTLFDEENISKILKDFSTKNRADRSEKESTYYKAILQNLFFATLNTKQEERKFQSEVRGAKGYNPDYGNHNVFRYHSLFIKGESLNDLFSKIPFLNGGLFECLDYKTKAKNERKYIDGFTSTKEQQPVVPNFLFFSETKKVDISNFYGTKNKTYEVEGLINLLNSYNFTIDENEPDDIEVALDPELLGSIFENLLASYNPETATTARKATGSFYTPREIVNYMTIESLKQYFKQGIGSILLPHNKNNEPIPKQDAVDTIAFLNPNDEIIIKQGKLPHWTQVNSWYFVTFRLADSIPKQKVEQLKKEREIWFKNHKKKDRNKYTKEELKEYYRLFSERVENWMNAGYGKCVLKDKVNAEIVANAIKHFEGKRYELDEWVVMPNHVHVLVKPFDNYQLSDILHSWKSFTANKINKNINLSGQLWMHESYDHIVRNEKAFKAIKNYIRQNPYKAGIVSKASSFQIQIQKQSADTENILLPTTSQKQTQMDELLDALFAPTSVSVSPKQDALDTLLDEETTKQLIKLINDLRVVDPAVGSGAFPMAMLNKLVFILSKLDPENKYWKQSQIDGVKKAVSDSVVQRKLIEQIERQFKEKNADYGRKLYLIQKCIYGVDIQQIAVEIAKLRFFISLLVDEKIDFNKPENNYGIEPLPNLDFKLMQGNSLISTYAGIDFNDDKEETNENLLFDDTEEPYKKLIKEFEELKSEYQNISDPDKKKDLRNQIDKAIIKIFEEKISTHIPQLKNIEEKYSAIRNKEQRQKAITEEKQKLTKKLGFDIEQVEKDLTAYTEGRKAKDFFLWDIYFAEVFSEKGGFDVVIGNPPYIQLQKAINGKLKFADLYKNENFKTFERTGDIYALFYEKGIDILTEKGLLCYITSNKWMRANYGKSLRKFLSKNNPLKLIDLGPGVFNTATVDTNILLVQSIREFVANVDAANPYKNTSGQGPQITNLKALTLNKNKELNKLSESSFVNLTDLSEKSWIILSPEEQKIKEKIERIGTPLKDWDINIYRGVLTGCNEAFIIDGKTKDELIAKDPQNAEIIKPILRGRDIKRYKAEFADLWLINTHNGYKNSKGEKIPPINIEDYPTIKEHLDKYWDKIKIRQDKGKTPYNLRNCAYYEEFEKEKIVYNDISQQLAFSICGEGLYFNNTVYFITNSIYNKYFISLLNTKSIDWYYKRTSAQLGEKAVRLFSIYVKNLPLPKISKSQQIPFEILVDKIITKKEAGEDTTTEERQIDIMVYKLYELTYDEVKIVEPEFALTKKEYENYG